MVYLNNKMLSKIIHAGHEGGDIAEKYITRLSKVSYFFCNDCFLILHKARIRDNVAIQKLELYLLFAIHYSNNRILLSVRFSNYHKHAKKRKFKISYKHPFLIEKTIL